MLHLLASLILNNRYVFQKHHKLAIINYFNINTLFNYFPDNLLFLLVNIIGKIFSVFNVFCHSLCKENIKLVTKLRRKILDNKKSKQSKSLVVFDIEQCKYVCRSHIVSRKPRAEVPFQFCLIFYAYYFGFHLILFMNFLDIV